MCGVPPSRTLTDRHVAELADLYGWRHHRGAASVTLDGYADGFPTHVLLRAGRLVFITITGATGALTPPQAAWTAELSAVTTVEARAIQRGELRTLTLLLRAGPASSPRKPGRPPRAGGGRRKPSQAPPHQEEQ